MKNISIEQFYKKNSKKVKTIAGYLENKDISWLIKSCRLKPRSVLEPLFNSSIEYDWFDEFAHIISFKDKDIKIKYDESIKPILSTDLYKNQTPKFVFNHSSHMLIADSANEQLAIFYCNDGYFRSFKFNQDSALSASALEVGVTALLEFKKSFNINGLSELYKTAGEPIIFNYDRLLSFKLKQNAAYYDIINANIRKHILNGK